MKGLRAFVSSCALALLLAVSATCSLQPVFADEPTWQQAPNEVTVQGSFGQNSTSHLWQGIIYMSGGHYISEHTLLGGNANVLWQSGMNGYALGPTLEFVIPAGLKNFDFIAGFDANKFTGDVGNEANWAQVTRLLARWKLGTQGASIKSGLNIQHAFGTSDDGKQLNQLGLFFGVSIGIGS